MRPLSRSLNADVTTKAGQITTLQGTVSQKTQEVTTLQGSVSSYKTQVAGLQSDLDDYKGQVTTLQTQFDLVGGYLRIAAYGWSMQFTNGMLTRIVGTTTGTSATRDSGKIYGYILSGSQVTDWTEVTYTNSKTAPDLDNAIMGKITDTGLNSYITQSDPKMSTTISGHPARYETLQYVYNGVTYYCVVAAWYCPDTQTSFVYYREATTASSTSVWEHFVDTFACNVS